MAAGHVSEYALLGQHFLQPKHVKVQNTRQQCSVRCTLLICYFRENNVQEDSPYIGEYLSDSPNQAGEQYSSHDFDRSGVRLVFM